MYFVCLRLRHSRDLRSGETEFGRSVLAVGRSPTLASLTDPRLSPQSLGSEVGASWAAGVPGRPSHSSFDQRTGVSLTVWANSLAVA